MRLLWRRHGMRAATAVARFGLAARTVFYLVLVYLVVRLAVGGGSGTQANAHGALSSIASHPGGLVAIALTALGFFTLGLVRIASAVRDRTADRKRRATTLLQGAFYLALTWIPASYALGRHSTGSEQQQHQTASGILRLPAGRELLFALGLVVIGICAYQIRTGLDRSYTDGLDTTGAPRWVRRAVDASGTVGIPARSAVFVPIGVCFMIAAVQSDPRHADGLDREVATLAAHAWGLGVLALVAAGLAVFSVYSALETKYRILTRSR